MIRSCLAAGLLLLSGLPLPASGPDRSGPDPAPGTFAAPHDLEAFVLPFEFYGMNLMVDAEMNGIAIKMLIDNGVMWDELLFYGSPLVDSLGMEYEGDVRVTGAGDDREQGTDCYTASDVTLSFGDVVFHGQSAVITPKDSGWAELFPGVAGQVCGTLFRHFVVEFDFDDRKMILHRPEDFRYEGTGRSVSMFPDEGGGYAIPVRIGFEGRSGKDRLLSIDLGGIYPVSLVVSEKYGTGKPSSGKVYLGHGASGEITGYHDNVESLTIGGYELEDVPAVLTESESGDHTNTTIGLPLLMRFNLVFDYFERKLYLEPNSRFDDP